jgi:hypothetical protein
MPWTAMVAARGRFSGGGGAGSQRWRVRPQVLGLRLRVRLLPAAVWAAWRRPPRQPRRRGAGAGWRCAGQAGWGAWASSLRARRSERAAGGVSVRERSFVAEPLACRGRCRAGSGWLRSSARTGPTRCRFTSESPAHTRRLEALHQLGPTPACRCMPAKLRRIKHLARKRGAAEYMRPGRGHRSARYNCLEAGRDTRRGR